jgi:hypothetical protein
MANVEAPQPATKRIIAIEADIKEIKESIKAISTKPRTWVEIVADTYAPK